MQDVELSATDAWMNDAARAIYPHAMIAPVPMKMRRRYLLRDEEQDEVRIVPELRRMVSFAKDTETEAWGPLGEVVADHSDGISLCAVGATGTPHP